MSSSDSLDRYLLDYRRRTSTWTPMRRAFNHLGHSLNSLLAWGRDNPSSIPYIRLTPNLGSISFRSSLDSPGTSSSSLDSPSYPSSSEDSLLPDSPILSSSSSDSLLTDSSALSISSADSPVVPCSPTDSLDPVVYCLIDVVPDYSGHVGISLPLIPL